MQEGSLFTTPAPAFIVSRFFDNGHSDWCEVSVIQSEVSPKEKNKYRMLMHIYGTKKKKNGTDEPSGRAGIQT